MSNDTQPAQLESEGIHCFWSFLCEQLKEEQTKHWWGLTWPWRGKTLRQAYHASCQQLNQDKVINQLIIMIKNYQNSSWFKRKLLDWFTPIDFLYKQLFYHYGVINHFTWSQFCTVLSGRSININKVYQKLKLQITTEVNGMRWWQRQHQQRFKLWAKKTNAYRVNIFLEDFERGLNTYYQPCREDIDAVYLDLNEKRSFNNRINTIKRLARQARQIGISLLMKKLSKAATSRENKKDDYEKIWQTHDQILREHTNSCIEQMRWSQYEKALTDRIAQGLQRIKDIADDPTQSLIERHKKIKCCMTETCNECQQLEPIYRVLIGKEAMKRRPAFRQLCKEKEDVLKEHAKLIQDELMRSGAIITIDPNPILIPLLPAWSVEKPQLDAWVIDKSKALSMITNIQDRRIAIAQTIKAVDKTLRQLKIKYHPDKNRANPQQEQQALRISQEIDAFRSGAKMWLIIGSRELAKFKPKGDPSNIDIDILQYISQRVNEANRCYSSQQKLALEDFYSLYDRFCNQLTRLNTCYEQFLQQSPPHPNQQTSQFWKDCIQWCQVYMPIIWYETFDKREINWLEEQKVQETDEKWPVFSQQLREQVLPALETLISHLEQCCKIRKSSQHMLCNVISTENIQFAWEEYTKAVERDNPRYEIRVLGARPSEVNDINKTVDEKSRLYYAMVLTHLAQASWLQRPAMQLQCSENNRQSHISNYPIALDEQVIATQRKELNDFNQQLDAISEELEKLYKASVTAYDACSSKEDIDYGLTQVGYHWQTLMIVFYRTNIETLQRGTQQWINYWQHGCQQPPLSWGEWDKQYKNTIKCLEKGCLFYKEKKEGWEKVLEARQKCIAAEKILIVEREKRIAAEKRLEEVRKELKELKRQRAEAMVPSSKPNDQPFRINFGFMSFFSSSHRAEAENSHNDDYVRYLFPFLP